MKDFILKKSSLFLLILSSLLLLTLVFNYLSEGGSSDIMIRGYEALFGTTVVDNIVTIKVEFNLFLIMIVLLPFILSLIALIYEKKYNKNLYFRITFNLIMFSSFLLAMVILSKFNYYMKGTFDIGGFPRTMFFTSFDLVAFPQIAFYLAGLGALLMFAKIVIDYSENHS